MCRAVLNEMHVIDDPFAYSMLHPAHRMLARSMQFPLVSRLGRSPTFTFLAARTLFFDGETAAALDDNVDQVVIVGAGYDSRAWRLAREGVDFFEVDHPATQTDKQRRAPALGPVYVAADLQNQRLYSLLREAGLRTDRRSVFVVEGLTMYLPRTRVELLLRDLAEVSAPGSRLAVNFTVQGGGSASGASRAIAWLTRTTWRWRGEPTYGWVRPDALPELLQQSGWTVRHSLPAPALATRYLNNDVLRLEGLNPGAICVAADLN